MVMSEHTKKALYLLNYVTLQKRVTPEGIIDSLNPILVAERMPDETTTLVALLHPVIKSGKYTIADLEKMGFHDDVIYGLRVILWDKSVPYKLYLERIKTCPVGMVVKLAQVNQVRQTLSMDDKNYWRYLHVESELESKFSVPFRMRSDEEQAKAKILRNRRWKNSIRGVMIGGAIGDALGFPVTNLSLLEIKQRWGEQGIMYDGELSEISSITQLAMFTASGILSGWTYFQVKAFNATEEDYIYDSYQEWFALQYGKDHYAVSWLGNVPEMRQMRVPDNETVRALESGRCGSLTRRYNAYKGCGGLVRVAPIALFHKNQDLTRDCVKFVTKLGASVAAITHGDPAGYLPAAMLCHIVSRLVFGGSTTGDYLNGQLREAKRHLFELFGDSIELRHLYGLIDLSLSLAANNEKDSDNIARIGLGWRADEALAIALYCAVRHSTNFDAAIIAAANHDGNSAATASVTGSIMGAIVGYEEIPQKWKDTLELHSVLLELVDDVVDECQLHRRGEYDDPKWRSKYDFTM